MNHSIYRTLAAFTACLGLAIPVHASYAQSPPIFQAGVDKYAVEHSGRESAWLFQQPLRPNFYFPYVIYEGDKISRLAPGASFTAQLGLDYAGAVTFLVNWEETAQRAQSSYRSLHGEIRSTQPGGAKLGVFRFTMRVGGTEMTGCLQLQDRSYCFAGKDGVGWLS